MIIVCRVCSHVLDEASSASLTPCGHVFHSNCLMSWLNRSETCPECRMLVTHKTVLKLPFNISSATDLAKLENEAENLENEFLATSTVLNACRIVKQFIPTSIEVTESKAAKVEEGTEISKDEIAGLGTDVGILKRINASYYAMLSRNINKIINGTQKDGDKKLEEGGNGSDVTRQMAFFLASVMEDPDSEDESKAKVLELNSKLREGN